MKRVYTLDYLRGIAALLILIYHFFTWQGEVFDGDHIIRRVGYYGVSIFYILSGLTLYYVYHDSFNFEKSTLKLFFVKRILRIFPLLWLVTILTIGFSRQLPEISSLFLNFTGLFGFFRWDSNIATGAWSIGNELVFYSFFPLLIYLAREQSIIFWGLGVCLVFITFYFSFHLLPSTKYDLNEFWKNYINPFNQLIYFFLGIAIGKLKRRIDGTHTKICITILVFSILVFFLYPTSKDSEFLVLGLDRYVFMFASVAIVYALYNLQVDQSHFYHKPLLFLGEISYGLYLFHPIVYGFLNVCKTKLHIDINMYLFIFICTLFSLALSYFSYVYFEKKAIKIGQKLLR